MSVLPGVAHAAAGRCEAAANSPLPTTNYQTEQQALEVGNWKLGSSTAGGHAVDEMLRGTHATAMRWDRVPELVVVTTVMQYDRSRSTDYRATSQQLTAEEAAALVADLTSALGVLTDNAYTAFASVRLESAAAGDLVKVMRPGQIVVGRYTGVRDQLATIGFGGRSTRGSTIRAGSIILDSDFDRTNDTRNLLRMHELGHALGYNHVQSRVSIMNPKIGPGPTDVDRAIARLAFKDAVPQDQGCPINSLSAPCQPGAALQDLCKSSRANVSGLITTVEVQI